MKILNYEELPRYDSGRIKWNEVEKGFVFKVSHEKYGYKEFILIDYEPKSHILHFKFGEKVKCINTDNFKNGCIGGITEEFTQEFKFDLEESLKDNRRDLIIINREYRKAKHGKSIANEKWYKYKCNICGWTEGWMIEGNIKRGNGCACCAGKIVVPEINSIWAREPWMMDLGISEEDAKKYLPNSNKSINVCCRHCNRKKKMKISTIYNNKSIGCVCGDGFSYPEKFTINVLTQLNCDFQTQLKNDWTENKKYDFYIPSINLIIETHGRQHYVDIHRKGARTLAEEQENDKFKRELALSNGIEHYIELDCRESDMKWIKNSILNSELNEIFDLTNIEWSECEKYALKNIVKEVCDYWNNKEEWETVSDLCKIFTKDIFVIINFLKKGNKFGWCNYNPKEE